MASLNSLWIKEETLKTLLETIQKKGEKGVSLTIALNDEANQWSQNVSAWVSQTKEQQEAKANKYYCGSGKTIWTNTDGVFVPPRTEREINNNSDDGGLPF